MSLLLHASALALLLLLAGVARESRSISPIGRFPTIALRAPRTASPGGGDRSQLPPKKGRLPERTVRRPFVPPMIARVDQPRLPLRQAVLEAPEFNIDAAEIGHPSGYGDRPSSGPAGLLSIGTRPGPGGPGDGGDGPGGFVTGQRPKPARVTRGPRVIYQEEPEYSEEARKARFQGAVVLQVEIGTDGRTSKIRVVRSVGLGLDERAIEAVSHWRFDPARNGEGPVAATALVEVSFHLL